MNTQQEPNRLIESTSPYLQQHAHNPVDWWPWCEEALELAKTGNKPILLSIGYSACHWCHVMAHESFEDQETAELMNRLFVNIKVDREERPDLDRIYQNAHQLLSQRSGGWPLTVFLTPDDQMPFFAGTYFPKEPRHGLLSFRDLMQRVHAAWVEQQDAIRQQNLSVEDALKRIENGGDPVATLDDSLIETAREQLAQSFDRQQGGFGQAPKFPHPSNLDFLLRYWSGKRDDKQAAEMALFTLYQMGRGGIFDQLGGGFCRYSVDDDWMIPHFEKMLYDNGPLLALNADAFQVTGDDFFADICRETASWVIREMQSPEGGYYSTLDADSEGEEGKFYVWTPGDAMELLEDTEYELFSRLYGLDREPNFEGQWHLHTFGDPETIADASGLSEERFNDAIKSARQKLFRAREARVRPGRDEKILTSWNALMIRGMARAGRVLGEPAWIDSAEKSLDFIRSTLWRDDRLLATFKDGKAHLNAYLDDYAYLIYAILELLQARWSDEALAFAIELAERLLEHFEDERYGGFYFTSDDHEQLIQRPKPMSDDAMPSGNGIAAFALQRLGYLLGDLNYLDAAEKTLRAAWKRMESLPHAHGALLIALMEQLEPPEILIARGDTAELAAWRDDMARSYRPDMLFYAIPSDTGQHEALAAKAPQEHAVVYRCRGMTCSPPESI
ncbi:MAG: thioredoxin domain-containing protein [Chromatiales bacterium]|jgi:hypothetical protein